MLDTSLEVNLFKWSTHSQIWHSKLNLSLVCESSFDLFSDFSTHCKGEARFSVLMDVMYIFIEKISKSM